MPTPRSPAAGQGQTQVTHSAALLFLLTGLKPVSVAAMTEPFELAVDLADAVVVRFANGAIGSLGSTGSVLPGQDEMLEYRIFGDRGHIVFDVNEGSAVIYGLRRRGRTGLPALAGRGALSRTGRRRTIWSTSCSAAASTVRPPRSACSPSSSSTPCTGRREKARTMRVGELEEVTMTEETIARVEALPLRYAEPNNNGKIRHVTLVRIETAGGAVGWGEAITGSRGRHAGHEGHRRPRVCAAPDRARPARRRGDLGGVPRDAPTGAAMAASSPSR